MTRTGHTVATRRIEAGSYDVIVNGENVGNAVSLRSLGYNEPGWLFSPTSPEGHSFHADTLRDIRDAWRQE